MQLLLHATAVLGENNEAKIKNTTMLNILLIRTVKIIYFFIRKV